MDDRENQAAKNDPKLDAMNAENDSTGDDLLVFQCNKCHLIIGDTTAWMCANEEAKRFTLKNVTENVEVGDKLTMSTEREDMGSTYVPLLCAGCEETIGRMYKTTPQQFDELRGLYTLHVPAIESYTVGSAEQCALNRSSLPEGFLSLSKIKFLTAQMRKLQQLFLTLNSRISALETSLCESGIDCHNATEESTSGISDTTLSHGEEVMSSPQPSIVRSSAGPHMSHGISQGSIQRPSSSPSINKNKRKTIEPEEIPVRNKQDIISDLPQARKKKKIK